jgi:NADPH-dependent ferric siderophore reductase
METSILQQIKKKAISFIEPQILKTGRVLEVRAWEPATMIEIDLHLPCADMAHWNEVPYIKFRVHNLCYRNYTPFGWDAKTRTCTILVDAGHDGPGSIWAKALQQNNTVHYLKIDTTHQSPDPMHLVVGLGDESSLGHLLALQQMTLPKTRFCGAVLMTEAKHHSLLNEYFGPALQPIVRQHPFGSDELFEWVITQGYCKEHTVFYLVGNDILVSKVRYLLKEEGYLHKQIKVKGFWS